ncbi:DEAD/DEAH box helicase [Desulfobacca acetoxidans]|uniref:Type III restriction protein res subunit n=1 Tax=Desulfobacca acetoxidans (strain ATCC 700848 / DSM 11109 / ASRB2) TaxID=880072 RepID=F2NDI0_DESAR|nr:DEAD/DEAH box helicase family protein [Desulfobacca acetoxidans]AEB10256.1 type III restriction protein res subunit [Desulfobacca acetoxidans DSM 11109]
MAFEVNEKNLAALEPLFNPWEEPLRHRLPNPMPGGPAIIQPGRRPSKCSLVRSIRAEVDGWRQGGYAGVSQTSRTLLTYWFSTEHEIRDEAGNAIPFRYHWAQREAIETIIYLYELRNIKSLAEMMTEFGGGSLNDLALGLNPEEDRWPRNCCKVATGGGKTKVMSLAIVWSYFHRLYEPGSDLARHFVIIAPNLTVYERLKDDFENCVVFYHDPLLPEEWKSDFQVQVVLQDEPGGASTGGAVYLTNIHRLYESRVNGGGTEAEGVAAIFGPPVKRAQALDTGAALRERITRHPRLMVLNDEAHHLHDPDLAWNKAIEALHRQSVSRGNGGVCLQLDFTATPKHTNGELFHHIVCDFPLGEAVDAGIVKVPVLGESDELVERGNKRTPARQRYANHLNLGYQRYEKTYAEWNRVRKPILFVMTEDAQAANEIADYLDSDTFPLLKGRVLNIHTRLKGKVKTVKRGGREIKEFVENETAMKPDDLRALREMSRELDAKDSKFRCVVSVMMLREGWDVRNVTTIVPLRPYSAKAGILPEQTLGRGLRRMFPAAGIPEMVTVVHHPAFRKLYEEELAQEGVDIGYLPIREVFKQTVTIFVDRANKPVADLEIELPLISDAVETIAELQGLTFAAVRRYFQERYSPLPVGRRKTGPVEYKERHLFTDEVVARMQLDAGLLTNAWSAAGYFAQMLGRACRLSNPHQILTPLVEEFLGKVLFEREVDLFSGEVDHRMREVDVMEHVRATFTPLILSRTVKKKERQRISRGQRLSTWKPYQASSTEKRPAVTARRTMFNLAPCENEFEQEFADFCDFADDIRAFAKNAGPQKLMIDYLKPDGHRAHYIPDFFVGLKEGDYLLVELKGKQDNLVPLKARTAVEWCRAASQGKVRWRYLYVPYYLFQQSAPATLEELRRACEPSLKTLLDEEKSRQARLPLEEATAQQEAEDRFTAVLQQAGMSSAPAALADSLRQAVHLLDYAVRAGMQDLSHAFQPLLRPLDEYAIKLLENRLRPCLPPDTASQWAYFSPYLEDLPKKEQMLLSRYQKYLRGYLVFGRPIFKVGLLLYCIDYAQGGGHRTGGVWADVEKCFADQAMAELFTILKPVTAFRNTRVAHVETKLDNPDEAWKAMVDWCRCLGRMAGLTYG